MQRLFSLLAVCYAFTASAQMATSSLQTPSNIPASPAPAAVATPTAPTARKAASSQTAVPGLINGYVQDNTYKLRVGDTISLQILEDQVWDPLNAPKNIIVQDSGEIDAPYIGRELAVGKTCKELATDIKTALEKEYYKQATVVISMNVASPFLGRVYVWGEVHNQGPLDLQVNENLTVGQAILRAGGFADFAKKSKVKVVRANTGSNAASKTSQTITLDMEQILDKGKTENDIVLQPGDLIIVPSRLINF